jgi:hypothetical protein
VAWPSDDLPGFPFTWIYHASGGYFTCADYEYAVRVWAAQNVNRVARPTYPPGHPVPMPPKLSVDQLGVSWCPVTNELAIQIANLGMITAWELRLAANNLGMCVEILWFRTGQRTQPLPSGAPVGVLQPASMAKWAELPAEAPESWALKEERVRWVVEKFTPGELAKLYRTLHEGYNLRIGSCRAMEVKEGAPK